MKTLFQHPLSAAFPAMCSDDFQALKDSIESIGVQNPITLFEGMVIDGWHRYTAANELGMDCPSVELGDVDPRDFVLAQNKARRHVTQAQLAMATTAVYDWMPHGGNRRDASKGTECPLKTTAQIAEAAGVSEKTIKQAKAVQTKAAPEVVEAVKRGEIGLPKAAAIAKLPKEKQAAAISKPTPKPVKEADPEPAYDPREDQIKEAQRALAEIAAENEGLRDRLAAGVLEGTDEEKQEAAQIIADLRKEVSTLEAELSAVKSSRDHFQREAAELRKQIKMNERELKKARALA